MRAVPVAEWSDDNDGGVGAPDGDPQKDIGDGHLGNLQLRALFTASHVGSLTHFNSSFLQLHFDQIDDNSRGAF